MPKKVQHSSDTEKSFTPHLDASAQPVHRRPAKRELSAIVGIGASAGGLDAFEKFFMDMPTDTGIAFVLVQHLAPNHPSMLTTLLQRCTTMPVQEANGSIVLAPDHVYVAPPAYDLAISNGVLRAIDTTHLEGLKFSIDAFLGSLAQDQGEQAIGIILSGTGSDGTQGCRDINEAGGMVMVQTPESAQYDGMPQSVLSTRLADYVLAPNEMPEKLVRYIQGVDGVRQQFTPPESSPAQSGPSLQQIFVLLRRYTGHDFSGYRTNTVERRIERRMSVNQIDEIADYVRYLRHYSSEVEVLFNDLLIGVTKFFRDEEAFATLQNLIRERFFRESTLGRPIRIWVAGCSTGEEAYSIAMLVQEQMTQLNQRRQVQIFATDIDHEAIAQARKGVYSESVANLLPPIYLERYMSKKGERYIVSKSIRDMIIFAPQNLIKDPPFSRLDLISCRNLLIYFKPELQRRILPLFHYALNPNGLLFLGSSETVGGYSDYFETLDKKGRLFQRQDISIDRKVITNFSMPTLLYERNVNVTERPSPKEKRVDLREFVEQILVRDHSPTSILVNENGDIRYIHGTAGKYLEYLPGEVGSKLQIQNVARPGLKFEVTSAIRKAVLQQTEIVATGLQVQLDETDALVKLTAKPVVGPDNGQRYVLLILEQDLSLPEVSAEQIEADASLPARDPRLATVEQELFSTRERLQTIIEEMETVNEELKSLNEEMQAANEELQSTNEELETSQEELQSVNEELTTVNAEHQHKNEQLSQANDDLNNLLASTEIATIFLDNTLRIKRFTPAAQNVFRLIQSDVGRPIADIVSKLAYEDLIQDVETVLRTLVSKELELGTKEGIWLHTRIIPYRTVQNVINGVVITFTNVTEQKQTTNIIRDSEVRLRAIVESLPNLIFTVDATGRILERNQLPPDSVRGTQTGEQIYHYFLPQYAEALRTCIAQVFDSGKVQSCEVAKVQATGTTVFYQCRFEPFESEGVVQSATVVATQILSYGQTEAQEALADTVLDQQVLLRTSELNQIVESLESKIAQQAESEASLHKTIASLTKQIEKLEQRAG